MIYISQWPPQVKNYVNRAFAQCKNDEGNKVKMILFVLKKKQKGTQQKIF